MFETKAFTKEVFEVFLRIDQIEEKIQEEKTTEKNRCIHRLEN